MTQTQVQFSYRRSGDQDRAPAPPAHHAIVIVGAGPVGLTMALSLAHRGVRSVVLDDSDRIGEGSRAICFAKRTLEIFDRLGVATPMLEMGVVWQRGRVFWGGDEIYTFDLLPEPGHKMPAFINLQQYHVERFLVEAAHALPDLIDLRWRNKVTGIRQAGGVVELAIDTPDGAYALATDWLVACDGARSPTRGQLGLDFKGEIFEDQFLIADVRMTAPFPTERWFWFDPPFHAGRSALLHKQPDDIWRIDLQMSPDADATIEREPARVRERIERMIGHRDFELVWTSIYRFQCRRLDCFVHGSVIFAGDAAHQVSPFGARGANSGIQDADNLAWKLAAVVLGQASPKLLATYDAERGAAADENILNSTRATDFIAPRSAAEIRFRDAALALAARAEFAKRFVNSGRLSTPASYGAVPRSPGAGVVPGQALPDAPLVRRDGKAVWVSELLGPDVTVIDFSGSAGEIEHPRVTIVRIGKDFIDRDGLAVERLTGGRPATVLVRPDGHVAAVFDGMTAELLVDAVKRIYQPLEPVPTSRATELDHERRLDLEHNRFADADAAYRLLVEAHRGLSEGESAALTSRLVLVLANQVGDEQLLREAIDLARNPANAET